MPDGAGWPRKHSHLTSPEEVRWQHTPGSNIKHICATQATEIRSHTQGTAWACTAMRKQMPCPGSGAGPSTLSWTFVLRV